ncbi:RND family efflux transporter MFP subunit [Mucilaginibacter auburnensis]|uniref:RND family efflux transporter MFP subunit n=2 Tax=Mucilaginibacter auburnensis TaxID=1457233 RepID=A0A2H9VSQ7_9SPHI|nr:RND family efflux transporter MFP subunit [Mucilaginibacter auburnensis]
MQQVKNLALMACIAAAIAGCKAKATETAKKPETTPIVKDNGAKILFPDSEYTSFFVTEKIDSNKLNAEISAPAKVAATIVPSNEGAAQNIVLFDNPDLASSYTSLLQNLVNIQQKKSVLSQKRNIIEKKKIEVDRFSDLQSHGVGTGKDVADAQVGLIGAQTDASTTQNEILNEETAIAENEARLKTGGFDPLSLRRAKAGSAYVICDIPESQISKIKEGQQCVIQFTAYPDQKVTGRIEDIADMVDASSRTVKLRIAIDNDSKKFKAGMYANVMFGVSEGDKLNISKNALVTVQGKNYVFVKQSPTVFARREINVGPQTGDRIIVYNGLHNGDAIATAGVMQLKGLSFGY